MLKGKGDSGRHISAFSIFYAFFSGFPRFFFLMVAKFWGIWVTFFLGPPFWVKMPIKSGQNVHLKWYLAQFFMGSAACSDFFFVLCFPLFGTGKVFGTIPLTIVKDKSAIFQKNPRSKTEFFCFFAFFSFFLILPKLFSSFSACIPPTWG